MALPLPNLDDHTYATLVEEAIAQIPIEYPEWTDHNPSDTGIILIELLAWLTEMVFYRVNQITEKNYLVFLSLITGKQWDLLIKTSAAEQQNLQAEIQNALLKLGQTYRAVTPEDFENLILSGWNQSQDTNSLKIARVKCLVSRNLESKNPENFAKGHITLIVVPAANQNQINNYAALYKFLNERKLLTTRLHIVEPEYVSLTIEARLILKDGAQAEDVKKQAETEVAMFFAPLESQQYWQGKGWPFGRNVYLSELYKLLDDLAGVDYVENLQIKDRDNHSKSEIDLKDNQLVRVDINNSKFTILVAVGNELKQI